MSNAPTHPVSSAQNAGKNERPIDIARAMFEVPRRRAATNGHRWIHGTFDECLLEYMRNGWVVSNHLFFVMAKATQIKDKTDGQLKGAWYVCFAIGALPMLLHSMPIRQPLIAFKRRDAGPLRIYNMDRFLRATRTCLALNNTAVSGT